MAAREKIVKLAQLIRGQKIAFTEADPEYYCLEPVVSDEMAEAALGMKRREYISAKKLAPKCKKSVEETQKLLLQLEDVGVIESRTTNGYDEFMLPIYVPGIFELMVLNKEQAEKHPQISRAFEQFTRDRIGPLAPNMPLGNGAMRVIPVETALDGGTRQASYEEISYWLDKYDPSISVGDCQCRRSRRLMGEGCGHLEEDMCIIVGDTAESCIRTGKTRRVTKQEALDIIKRAEENGLMHQVTNMDGPDKIFAICNCCVCSCFALRTSQYFNAPNMSRSNYLAKVDKEKCVACGQCVETCPANAVKLGQKLCTEKPIKLKETLLPDDHDWGPEQWNPEFRDNRKDVVETGTAPCKTTCPAHIAVQGYIKLASQGDYTQALELIKKENPFPAVCGRICPHNCENECTRGKYDEPIAIDEIKKFIADRELNSADRFIPKRMHEYGKKIAIVGAGPAGLSCAYYLAIDGYKVTVFEKQEKLGGMLTMGIPSFRLEKDVIGAEIDILREMGVEFKTGVEVGRDVTLAQLREQDYKAFYLAIGAQAGRKLGIDGEDAAGVITGVDFLRNVNLGKGETLTGKVVVIGGGNVAIDVARTATRQGAETLNMYCLESAKEMPALPDEIEEAQSEGIAIHNSYGPKRIVVENGKVTGVEFKKCTAVFDKNGKFAPQYDENATIVVEADYVLLSVGQSIEWGNLLKDSRVELNRNNTAVADSLTYQTAERDVFVGGDVFTGPKFAIDAIAAGKQAAISLHRAVWEGQSLSIGRDRREYVALDKNNLDKNVVLAGFDNTPRQKPGHNTANEKTFKDTRVTFTEEQLKRETSRCLGCGASIVDENRCLGCGLCTVRCKFDAISLVKVFDIASVPYEKVPPKVAVRMVKRKINIVRRKMKDKHSQD
ncbi:MAG: FAD-dependent oxidoreductase [Oscillospiraceae bacterium]